MRVAMFVASEDATSGSVIENAERIRPSRSGCSQRSCCSGVPNSDSSSMLPVSGAEQFSASGAIHRSEEHTSELQSHVNLVCRLLLEKKNKRSTMWRDTWE